MKCTLNHIKYFMNISLDPFMLHRLKGWSYEIRKACRWFHLIDLKFKGFRIMFIFDLDVVFIMDCLKNCANP
jgi:hypothetical protein